MQRLRAFLVTIALVLGAGTMSAVAAPLLRGHDVATVATETPTDGATESTGEATEDPTEPVADPTERVPEPENADDQSSKQANPAQDDAKDATAKAERGKGKPAHAGPDGKGKGRDKAGAQSNGKGHGKAVSDAARGITPPVGDCRNHGHWVSTVAKGKSSCDDNPRPPRGSDD